MKELFQNTLGEGRTDPIKRPSIFHWTPALLDASDQTIECPKCEMHFYYNEKTNHCEFCKESINDSLIFTSYLIDKKNKEYLHWEYIREFNNESKISLHIDYSILFAINLMIRKL